MIHCNLTLIICLLIQQKNIVLGIILGNGDIVMNKTDMQYYGKILDAMWLSKYIYCFFHFSLTICLNVFNEHLYVQGLAEKQNEWIHSMNF